jgi:transposase InsO family protein
MITMLKGVYPVQKACQMLGYPRSSYYYSPKVDEGEQRLKQAIQTVAGEWPTYGYRRITAQLNRQGWAVNHKRIYRLMGQMGIRRVKKAQKRRTTNSQHPFPRYPNLVQGLAITFPDQVWAADITYIRLGKGFVYLAVIIDLFTRSIRGWNMSRGLDQQLTLLALQRALQEHKPMIHHSDQGLQYAAREYIEMLHKAGVKISMAEIGEPTQNGYAERLLRTIKEEEVDLSEYQDFQECYRNIDRFLNDVYMYKRIHSSLGYLTPVEFEYNWFRQNMPVEIK